MNIFVIKISEDTEISVNQRGEITISQWSNLREGHRDIRSIYLDEKGSRKVIDSLPEVIEKAIEIKKGNYILDSRTEI